MIEARYAVYYFEPSQEQYVFTASSPDQKQMQKQADYINSLSKQFKAVVIKSSHPNDRIDPYHQDFYKSQKAFA